MSPIRPYLHLWNNTRPFPLCRVCRFPMTFPADAEHQRHLSCMASSWPRGTCQRTQIRNPFHFTKEQK